MIQLIISPDNGWEDIKATSKSIRARNGMIGMLLVASLSPFVRLLYDSRLSVIECVQEFVIVLVSFWATYFFAGFMLCQLFPKINGGVIDEDRTHIFNAYIISLLSIQVIISNVLPLTFAILTLWPIYVVIIMWRGMKYMDMDANETGKFLCAVVCALILPSQLLFRGFNSLL